MNEKADEHSRALELPAAGNNEGRTRGGAMPSVPSLQPAVMEAPSPARTPQCPARQRCPLGADALGRHTEGKYDKRALRPLSLSASSRGVPRRVTAMTPSPRTGLGLRCARCAVSPGGLTAARGPSWGGRPCPAAAWVFLGQRLGSWSRRAARRAGARAPQPRHRFP